MIATHAKVKAAIAALPRRTLDALAYNILCSMYGRTYRAEDAGRFPTIDALNLEDGDRFFDSGNAWDECTIESVADDILSAGLDPEDIK